MPEKIAQYSVTDGDASQPAILKRRASGIIEPVNTVFLSQVADGAFHLGLVSESDLEMVFKLNCLFFDHIAIGASGLLCNKLLYNYLRTEHEAIASLYQSRGASGSILRPVLWEENHQSICNAADNMLAANTIHYLEGDADLIDHAQRIEEMGPTYLNSSEMVFRERYKEHVKYFVDYLARVPSSMFAVGFEPSILERLSRWLSARDAEASLRCSDLYRFAEKDLAGDAVRAVKRLGDCLYSFSLASTLWTEFSAPQPVAPLVQIMRVLSREPGSSMPWSEVEKSQRQREEISARIPLQAILRLPLADILILRDLESFSAFRQTLSRFRAGGVISPAGVQKQLDVCRDQLLQYAYANEVQRSNLLSELKEAGKSIVLRFIYDVSASVSPIALSILYPQGQVPLAIATITSVALLAANQVISRKEASPNTIFPHAGAPDIQRFHPRDGTISSAAKRKS